MLNTDEEKIWEKPWSNEDLKTFSTSWSLAGDSGLLLSLKQLSENFISKSVTVEKKLQKLVHDEQQCQVKLNNATSSFLMLENSQFIENRVYEHETIVEPVDEGGNQEKTKEEKELDLFNKMTEACEVGMSIMDTYFDKLNAKDIRKNRNADSEEDDDDDEEVEYNETENADDLIIYEAKDPYVLRSLPYLIGSQAFLENDHVGLKDLDSEEEEEEEVDDEDEADLDTDKESLESSDEKESNEADSSENEDLFDSTEKKTNVDPKKKSIVFDNVDDEDDDDDGGLFGSHRKKKASIFDDDSDSDNSENIVEETKPTNQYLNETNSDTEESKNVEPIEAPKPKTLDFASELSRKLANKNKPVDKQKITEVKVAEPEKPKAPEITAKAASNLFDDDEKSDDNDIFASSNPVQRKSVKKGLFDDSDDDSDIEPIKKEETQQKSDINSALNDIFSKKPKESLFKSDDDEAQPELKKEAPKPTKKISIFDSDNEDEDNDDFKLPKPTKSKVKSSLFDDEDDDLFSPLTANAVVKKPVKKVSLFSDSSDTSPEDLFSNKSQSDTRQNLEKKPVKTNTKSLFDSTDSATDDQHNNTLNKKPAEKDVLFTAPRKNSDLTKRKESIKKSSESPKPKKKTPLFSSSTDDDNNNLFQSIKKPEPVKKIEKAEKKKASLFEDSSEDLFTESKPASKKTEKKKASLFDDSSDELFSDKKDELPETKEKEDSVKNPSEESDKPRKSIVKKDMLFNPTALANSSIFKKMADKNEDSEKISDPLAQINDKESIKKSDSIDNSQKNTKIDKKEEANETTTKKASLFDDSSDELFKTSTKKAQIDNSNKKASIFDDSSDELFPNVSLEKEPSKPATKSDIFKSDSSEDLFSASSKKEPSKPEPKSDLFKSDSSEDLFTTSSSKEQSKPAPKTDIFKSDSSEDLFKPPSSKEQTKPEKKSDIFKSDSSEDLFTSKTKKEPASKSDIFKSDSSEDLFQKPTKKEPSKPAPKTDIFKSDSSEDLFKITTKKELSKPTFKSDIFKSDSSDTEAKSVKSEELPKKINVKNIGKNLVFGPGALASSGLFKKLSEKAKAENSDIEKSDNEVTSPVVDSKDSFDAFASDIFKKPTKNTEPEPSLLTDDLFGDIKVDKAFTEKSFKSAQRDRIQISGRKKRPPTNRKQAAKPETQDTKLLDEDIMFPDPEPSSDAKQIEEPVKNIKEDVKSDSIFDSLVDDDFKDLDIFKAKKKPKAMRPSIFEDETDIFADMPTTSKPHVPKPKKEIKQKERKSLVPSDTDIFATLSDDEDIFKIVADKKKPKKTIEVIEDPLNFS